MIKQKKFSIYFAREWDNKNEQLKKKLDSYLDAEQKELALSQKVVVFLNSINKVSSTLIGIRKMKYMKIKLKV